MLMAFSRVDGFLSDARVLMFEQGDQIYEVG